MFSADEDGPARHGRPDDPAALTPRWLRGALALYATAMIAVGAAVAWRAPLEWDERIYYEPAIRYVAERLPAVPLDYPMPMPPLALLVQAALFRMGGGIELLRALSTLAAIATAYLLARMLRGHDGPRAALLLLMAGTFPATLLHAFTIKQHALVMLAVAGGLAAWQSRRRGLALLSLTLATLIHQLACAMPVTLALLELRRWRRERSADALRNALLLGLTLVPLALLVLAWGGLRPPMHATVFIHEPALDRIRTPHLLLMLFMLGLWVVPALGAWRRTFITMLLASPLTMWAAHASGLARHGADVYDHLAGPAASAIRAALPHDLAAALLIGLIAAAGATLFTIADDLSAARLWCVVYTLPMLAVPYYFESYYALMVVVAWLLVGRTIVTSASRVVLAFQAACVIAGAAYLVVKV